MGSQKISARPRIGADACEVPVAAASGRELIDTPGLRRAGSMVCIRAQGSGLRAQGLRLKAYGSGLTAQGSGYNSFYVHLGSSDARRTRQGPIGVLSRSIGAIQEPM